MASKPTGRSFSFWWRNLEVSNKDLANRVLSEVGTLTEGAKGPGHVRVPLYELTEATRDELWAELPFLSKMKAPGANAMAESQKMDEIIIADATREAKIRNDNDAGLARLKEWGATGLLEDTPTNAAAIQQWLENNVRGYMSVAGVDAAIANLGPKGTNVLTWRKPAPPAPVVQEPVETLATLSDGTKQLKLGTVPTRSHTITQLRDLDQRERVARGKQQGHFATRF